MRALCGQAGGRAGLRGLAGDGRSDQKTGGWGCVALWLVKVTTWACDKKANFIAGAHYAQTDLTSMCPSCSANPVYGVPNSNEKAVAYCKQKCENHSPCFGFFYQKHINGHEICGFYNSPLPSNAGPRWDGHAQGSRICMKSSPQQALKPRDSTVHV